ncbi:MAG: hypothetical protein IKP06_00325 [Elusimicrobiaceae bacterium]|nr:hypothetical protein [Elusimicrobiaceae bacterium]
MKKMVWFVAVLALCLAGCTPKTVLSQTYDFNQMKRIGVMSFSNERRSLKGVENLFAKYLIESGFKVVERAQLESILQEHNISVSGYLSAQTTRKIGQILGVDVLLVGEISAYRPARTELALTATRRVEEKPVYTQDVMRLPDGSYAGYVRNVGTQVSRSTDVRPTEYTINSRVAIIAKMVDVETAEIVWIGSDDDSSSSALDAADNIARRLVKSFGKELAKREKGK